MMLSSAWPVVGDDLPRPTEVTVVVGPNRADEPVATEFSRDRAAGFLQAASLEWQAKRKCMACHTNYAYLYACPTVSGNAAEHGEVRTFAEDLVSRRWKEKGPRWDTEVVATAAALAFNDAATTGRLHRLTRQALDRMWTVQRSDGGWTWLKCGWPPMESDDHYGVTLAAIAVGVAPEAYARTEAAQQGLAGIRKYLKNTPPQSLHHQAMILWASSYIDDLTTAGQRQSCIDKLLALQQDDGGWVLATLGTWDRSDGREQDTRSSDGYGTGFVIYVLRQAGVPASHESIQRGLEWLKTHQRESGRWFTRSLNSDNKHYLTHAGTAMALMALAACDPVSGP
jgi:squalene-hopene/tetraprenyl-beta-curcumene cyclase